MLAGEQFDLTRAPAAVTWVKLDGSRNDHEKLLEASEGQIHPTMWVPSSLSPKAQVRRANKNLRVQIPGAVTVEAVDLRDLVTFARDLNMDGSRALLTIGEFAEKVMTNMGAADLVRRVDAIIRGTEGREASAVELSAIAFQNDRCHRNVIALLVEMNKQPGVRVFSVPLSCGRPSCLELCCGPDEVIFEEAVIQVREQRSILDVRCLCAPWAAPSSEGARSRGRCYSRCRQSQFPQSICCDDPWFKAARNMWSQSNPAAPMVMDVSGTVCRPILSANSKTRARGKLASRDRYKSSSQRMVADLITNIAELKSFALSAALYRIQSQAVRPFDACRRGFCRPKPSLPRDCDRRNETHMPARVRQPYKNRAKSFAPVFVVVLAGTYSDKPPAVPASSIYYAS